MKIGRVMAVVTTSAVVLISILAGVVGCKSGTIGTAPSLYVGPSGDIDGAAERVANNGTVYFAEGGGTMTLVLGNVGDALLKITSIELVTQNSDITVSPVLTDVTFPLEVQPNDYKQVHETVFTMTAYYTPDADRDISPTTIKVTTNDYQNQDGIFTFNVQPKEKTAEIKVTPNNAIFLGATSSSPDPVEFTIDNVGDAALALAAVRFNPPTTAYSITAGYIRENLMIDPYPYGTDNGAVNLTITYRPVNPPDQTDFEILWGSKIDTGVECTNTPTCQNSEKLCPDKTKVCPYTCFNGMCGCLMSSDCAAYFCENPADCEYRCLTSVCRIPEVTKVPLRGEAQAGNLEITYGDQADGCVDFTTITVPGNSCTKRLSLENAGPGSVILSKPSVKVAGGLDSPYTVKWYKLGATQDPLDECGAVTGEEISDSRYTLTPDNSPITVAVTYTAPSINGVSGDLEVPYSSPFAGEEIVRLCGGVRKGELAIAPLPESIRMTLYAAPGSTAEKSVVVMNKGNLELLITSINVESANVDDPEAFSILEDVAGGFTLAEGEVRAFTVSFTGDHDGGTTVNGFVNVNYMDPLIDMEVNQKVNVAGFNSFEGVTLPVAEPGEASDYTGVKVGDSVVFDASSSVAGTYDVPLNSGYIWFVYDKPDASRVFLNTGGGQPQITVIPDVAGTYEFRLIVYSVDTDSTQAYFSSEGSIRFDVTN